MFQSRNVFFILLLLYVLKQFKLIFVNKRRTQFQNTANKIRARVQTNRLMCNHWHNNYKTMFIKLYSDFICETKT